MAKKILITGASGLIGTRLTEILQANGNSVVHLVRAKRRANLPSYEWDPTSGSIDAGWLKQTDTIVHLSGAGVADKRWTLVRKKEILDSRLKSTALLCNTLKNRPHTIQTFVSASAIGYYGFDDDRVFAESDESGRDFLAGVTKQWEDEIDQINAAGVRVVKLRIGIVLSEKGGAFKKMATPVKLGFGAALGTGKQFLSWVHLDDLCAMFIKAIEDDKMSCAYKATTAWCTNQEMTTAIAKALHKPRWLPPVPSIVLKIMLGEMADIVLHGSKISSVKIRSTGFQYRFPDLEDALFSLTNKL